MTDDMSSDGSCSDYEDYDGIDYNDYFEEAGDSNSIASDDEGEPDGTHLFQLPQATQHSPSYLEQTDDDLPSQSTVNPATTKNVLL